ncbi:hypothetical protein HK101_005348 [Irineochytrium annulatum]|nr:hypothetical protein HK101_005348 [Irineochytrium annulatum]
MLLPDLSSASPLNRPPTPPHSPVLSPSSPAPAFTISSRASSPPSTITTAASNSRASSPSKSSSLRKVSHSAIERRRRERINEVLMKLRDMVPKVRGDEGCNKIDVLGAAVEYIAELEGRVAGLEGGARVSERRVVKESVGGDVGPRPRPVSVRMPPMPFVHRFNAFGVASLKERGMSPVSTEGEEMEVELDVKASPMSVESLLRR